MSQALQARGKRVVIALWSEGSRERMSHVLAEHGLVNLTPVGSWPQALALPRRRSRSPCSASRAASRPAMSRSSASRTFSATAWCGRAAQRSGPENFIAEATSLSAGDLVVHVDHGIGRFVGLQAIEAAGAPHDCLEIHYAGGDKLFLPVENIELLSRYGSEETDVELDRLGGGDWQARKARMKNRIREMAGELIKIAAERQLREAPKLDVAPGPLRRILRRLSLRGDRRPAGRNRRGARRSGLRPADGPADVRRRRLRQDRDGATRRLRHRDERQAGRGRRADHLLARQHTRPSPSASRGFPVQHRAGFAAGLRRRLREARRALPKAGSTSSSAPMRCSARPSSSRISASSSSTRSSISASPTRSGSSSCAPKCTCSR